MEEFQTFVDGPDGPGYPALINHVHKTDLGAAAVPTRSFLSRSKTLCSLLRKFPPLRQSLLIRLWRPKLLRHVATNEPTHPLTRTVASSRARCFLATY